MHQESKATVGELRQKVDEIGTALKRAETTGVQVASELAIVKVRTSPFLIRDREDFRRSFDSRWLWAASRLGYAGE